MLNNTQIMIATDLVAGMYYVCGIETMTDKTDVMDGRMENGGVCIK